ncbi:MAG: thioredoxin fold domain-containing protein [Candidatus Latescibacteria bacterium]|nr:thioredoxin fold domain-containing protein [Candidatus Latescibacterota bacterium]NIO78180.1 thioredoxin fold domain-containing protein [Candidatus Latescibacterota bacterium]
MRFIYWVLGVFVAMLALVSIARSSEFNLDYIEDPVTLRAYTGFSSVSQGGTIPVAVAVRIGGHWHINAHEVNDEYLIPTSISLETAPGIDVRKIIYPNATEKRLSFSDKPLALYEGEVFVGVLIGVAKDFPLGDTTVVATLTYQACDNEKCIAPVNEPLVIPFRVSPPTEAIDAIHTEIFSKINFGLTSPPTTSDDGAGIREGTLSRLIATKGLLLAFLTVFIAGMALNLTPCVYPMIPITVSYFGGQSRGKSSRTVFLAILYLLGMAIMYSSLGLIASLTGSLFGSALQNPYVLAFVALVLVGLALSMFGFYEIRIPAKLSNVAGTSKQGAMGAFFMGLTVGIVAAPCIGPFVLGLLTFVGESGNPALGFSLFFTLAVGLGLPFVVLAVISGSISKLPKSGEWMEWVRKLFGGILLAMAVYFLKPIMASWLYALVLGLVIIACGIVLGFVVRSESTAPFFRALRRAIGIIGPILGLYIIFSSTILFGTAEEIGIKWEPYSDDMLAKAKVEGRFVLIDFSADWCIPCKELDHKTFSQDDVVKATEEFVRLKADLTQAGSEANVRLRKIFRIRGVPTVIFVDQDGNEREDLRVVGFVDAKEFLSRLHSLKAEAI